MPPEVRDGQISLRDSVAVTSAVSEDNNAIGDLQQLFFLARHNHHRAPLARKLADDAVDLQLRSDVNALGRLIE